MKRKKLLTLIGSLCLILALVAIPFTACAPTAPTAPPVTEEGEEAAPVEELPELEIKMIHLSPSGTPQWERMDERPGRMIEEATHGRVTVTHYPGCSLVPGPDMYRAIQEGIADFGWVYSPMTPGAFPLCDLFTQPGLFPNMATSNLVLNVLFDEYPCFYEQFSPKVKHISTQLMLRPEIHSRVPIRTLADLKGKIIGCQDALSASALAKAGASTSVMPSTDMYVAGERGVVDAVVIAWGAFGNWHLYEVYNYHTLVSLTPACSHFLMNRDTWNKFTPEEQEKIELLRHHFQYGIMEGACLPGRIVREEEALPEKGHEIIVWSEEDMNQLRETFRPFYNAWTEDMEDMGYPGKEILERAEWLLDVYGYRFG